MRVNDDLLVLELDVNLPMGPSRLNLSLLPDPQHGPTLIDTGIPGRAGAIGAALGEAGLKLSDLRRVILTHQDLDHTGSLARVVAAGGAPVEVLAHADDAPYIDGRLRPIKMRTPEQLEAAKDQFPPAALQMMSVPPEPVPVTRLLRDGEILDLAGGVRVLHTPGHTPGHISLYLERSRTLIAGDALVAQDGRLSGPVERATPDMPLAVRSLARLAELEPRTIVCYHGGVVTGDAAGQLRRLAAGLARGRS